MTLPPDRVRPHPDRLAPDAPTYEVILVAHDAAMASGDDRYDDPLTGYSVLTARFLWERGYCCELGCRHCPWLERPP